MVNFKEYKSWTSTEKSITGTSYSNGSEYTPSSPESYFSKVNVSLGKIELTLSRPGKSLVGKRVSKVATGSEGYVSCSSEGVAVDVLSFSGDELTGGAFPVDYPNIIVREKVSIICDSLKEKAFKDIPVAPRFEFGGTMAQWEEVPKDEGWLIDCPYQGIYCTDGYVEFKEE